MKDHEEQHVTPEDGSEGAAATSMGDAVAGEKEDINTVEVAEVLDAPLEGGHEIEESQVALPGEDQEQDHNQEQVQEQDHNQVQEQDHNQEQVLNQYQGQGQEQGQNQVQDIQEQEQDQDENSETLVVETPSLEEGSPANAITSEEPKHSAALDSYEDSDLVSSSGASSDANDSDSDSEFEEEPQLKYSRIATLPTSLSKDAVSCFLVQRNFKAFATHGGVIYLLSSDNNLIRTYRAHRASVLSLSSDGVYLASASIDGTVVIGSVIDSNDIIAADFQRPVHAVALDPNYKTTKAYISGGMAGRVVHSERNWLGKRIDVNIDDGDGDNGAICGIFWLPNGMVLWMNDLGISVYSVSKKKVVHIVKLPEDAPRADLYRPRICMPKGDLVYVAWGQYIWALRFTILGGSTTLSSDQSLTGGAAGMALLSSNSSIKSFGLVEEKAAVESWRKVPWLISGIASFEDDKLLLLCYFGPRQGERLVTDAPELKIVDWQTGEELYADVIMVKAFERLGMNDYQMMSSSDFTITARNTNSDKSTHDDSSWVPSWLGPSNSEKSSTSTGDNGSTKGQASAMSESANFYIVSAHDTIIASKRDSFDHYNWLLEHQQIKSAWQMSESLIEPEERKDLGLRLVSKFISQELWEEAAGFLRDVLNVFGKQASPAKVAAEWDSWGWQFIHADKQEYLAPVVPKDTEIACKMDICIYNEIIGYHLNNSLYEKLAALLKEWPIEIYDVESIKTQIEQLLQNSQDSLEKAPGDRKLEYLLAQLYIATNELYPAVQHLLNLHNPTVLDLIEEHHLLPLFIPSIPDILTVELGTKNELQLAPIEHIRDKTRRAVKLTVSLRHEVLPDKVVSELLDAPENMDVVLFLYLEELNSRDSYASQAFADLQVKLYAEFDRPKLSGFLKKSGNYDLGAAVEICEKLDYVSELVYLLGKVGQNKRALKLITEKLGDPEQAIEFAKYQNDRELWHDLVEYSKDRPLFIQALLDRHYLLSRDDSGKLISNIAVDLQIPELKQLLLKFFGDNEMTLSLTRGALSIMQNEACTYSDKLKKLRLSGEVVDLQDENDARFTGLDLSKSILFTPDDKVVNESSLIGEKALSTVDVRPGWSISWKLNHLLYILKNLGL